MWRHSRPPGMGFNSATALQPWKPPQTAAPGRGEGRFNSATALQPWKPANCRTWAMRGGALQFGHGSSAVETSIRGSEGPCSDCFNSATALQPWKPRRTLVLRQLIQYRFNSATALQPWKPSHGRSRVTGQGPASIRPRLFSRGNLPYVAESVERGNASIRPRLFSRGNSTECLPRIWASALQFGHGSSAVETPTITLGGAAMREASIRPRLFSRGNAARQVGRPPAARVLQFGHGSSAVETTLGRSSPERADGFNSATALQPWKP